MNANDMIAWLSSGQHQFDVLIVVYVMWMHLRTGKLHRRTRHLKWRERLREEDSV